MKAVLMSIHPKWCEKIFNGSKTIEVRKSRPSIPTPFKVYVYMTKHKWIFKLLPFLKNRFAKVIGEFVCDEIIEDKRGENADVFSKFALLSLDEQKKYGANKPLYGWHISDLKIYDKPKEVGEFSKFGYKYAGGCCINYECHNCIDNGWMQSPECKIDGCFLTRPPQSWVYCEPIEEE